MAGDWLKMRHDLADDPAVIRLASACGLDEFAVLGRLHALWSWADRHTTGGHAEGLGFDWVDRKVRCDGFAVEMVRVGWLEETGSGLTFPRFDRHCSDTAKARALTKNRVERHRNAAGVTDALPEKRREESLLLPRARELSGTVQDGWETLLAAWRSGPGVPYLPPEPPDEAVDRLSEPGWLDAALKAIGRLRGCKYFDTPVPLQQFCLPRFVFRINQGRYDLPKAEKSAQSGDCKTAAAAAEAWRRAAEDPEKAKQRAEFMAAKRRRSQSA